MEGPGPHPGLAIFLSLANGCEYTSDLSVLTPACGGVLGHVAAGGVLGEDEEGVSLWMGSRVEDLKSTVRGRGRWGLAMVVQCTGSMITMMMQYV